MAELGERRLTKIRCLLHKDTAASCWIHKDGTWFCFSCMKGGTWEFGLGGYSLEEKDMAPKRQRQPGEDAEETEADK